MRIHGFIHSVVVNDQKYFYKSANSAHGRSGVVECARYGIDNDWNITAETNGSEIYEVETQQTQHKCGIN